MCASVLRNSATVIVANVHRRSFFTDCWTTGETRRWCFVRRWQSWRWRWRRTFRKRLFKRYRCFTIIIRCERNTPRLEVVQPQVLNLKGWWFAQHVSDNLDIVQPAPGNVNCDGLLGTSEVPRRNALWEPLWHVGQGLAEDVPRAHVQWALHGSKPSGTRPCRLWPSELLASQTAHGRTAHGRVEGCLSSTDSTVVATDWNGLRWPGHGSPTSCHGLPR